MDTVILIAVVLLVLGNIIFFVIFLRRGNTQNQDNASLLIQQQLQDLSRTIDSRLSESSKNLQSSMQVQLKESSTLVREVTSGLTKLEETNKRVISYADELQNLQNILKNPKQRGVLGEYYLESVLKNVLPPNRYQMQYKFSDGEIVDAVIFLEKDKILPVDSKFSLENYNRLIETEDKTEKEKIQKLFKQDLKNRIDETSKYIRPEENTMDFAFMFIPSEGIYYDLLVGSVGTVSSRDLIEYAFRDKKVIIVSPTSFLAYVQTVMQGLRALEIEESAKLIRKRVEELGRHLHAYNEYFLKLGSSLGTTVNHYNAAGKELHKVDKDVLKIAGISPEIERIAIEKPDKEE
jgi:DNA recombination protein RmuC